MTWPIYEQEGLNTGATILHPNLDQKMKALAGAPQTWQNTSFSALLGGSHFGEGALNFSPGWFQQLCDVRLNQFLVGLGTSLFLNSQQLEDYLYVSASLKTPLAVDFLKATISIDVISNAITALVVPQQYDVDLAVIQLIKNSQHLYDQHPILDSWILVWSGFAMIVNRDTLLHRALGGAPEDFDLLFSSETHNTCNLDVLDLGAMLLYCPGTAVAITGRVL
jgi:hypothetical protein